LTNNGFSATSGNSYSQALYELSLENKSSELIEEQVRAVLQLFEKNQDLNDLVKNPTIKQENQLKVFKLISEKFNFNELFIRFINFLIEKRRLFYIKKILRDFLIICSEKRGEIQAQLTAAKKLTSEEIEKIKKELKENFGSNIKLNYKHDESLIGGLIIQVGSVMIDTTIKNKLKQAEQKMIEA